MLRRLTVAVTVLVAGSARPQDLVQGPIIERGETDACVAGKPLTLRAHIVTQAALPADPTAYVRAAGEETYEAVPMRSDPEGGSADYVAAVPIELTLSDFDYYLVTYDSVGNGPSLAGSPTDPLRVACSVARGEESDDVSHGTSAPAQPPLDVDSGIELYPFTGFVYVLGADYSFGPHLAARLESVVGPPLFGAGARGGVRVGQAFGPIRIFLDGGLFSSIEPLTAGAYAAPGVSVDLGKTLFVAARVPLEYFAFAPTYYRAHVGFGALVGFRCL